MLAINKYYRLYVVKEISVTDSFLTLKDTVKRCQKETTFDECTTQKYLETLKLKCSCLPRHLGLYKEVRFKI